MGTDNIGRDLASGLIHGTRISLSRCRCMGIASIIGVFLGAMAGFYGDRNLRMPRIKYYLQYWVFFLVCFMVLECVNTPFLLPSKWIKRLGALIKLVTNCSNYCRLRFISRFLMFGKLKDEVSVLIDTFVSRGIEILNSIPRLILIITISAIFTRSIWLIMTIIGLTSWTGIARFTRAEFLRLRELESPLPLSH